jgi:hypothetical protein
MNKKKEILIVFPTYHQGEYFFKEHFDNNMIIKKHHKYTFESDICMFRILNFEERNLRGRRADFIYLHEDYPLGEYIRVIKALVKDDNNIRVVI